MGIALRFSDSKLKNATELVIKRFKGKKVYKSDMGTRRAVMVGVAYHKLSTKGSNDGLAHLSVLRHIHPVVFIDVSALRAKKNVALLEFLSDFDMVGQDGGQDPASRYPTGTGYANQDINDPALTWEQFRSYYQLLSSYVESDTKFERDVVEIFAINPEEVSFH
jgi:hypothetical protein